MKTLYLGLDAPSDTESIHCPMIKIYPRPIDDLEVMRFLDDIEEYTHLVFTSKYGVSTFFRCCPDVSLSSKQIISIGKATTAVLQKHGVERIITAKNATQEGVHHELALLDLTDAYIGIPCSSKARMTLSVLLAYAGVRHQIGPLYDTEANVDVTLPSFDAIEELVFTSPSVVDAFYARCLQLPDNTAIRSIGPSTSARLLDLFGVSLSSRAGAFGNQ